MALARCLCLRAHASTTWPFSSWLQCWCAYYYFGMLRAHRGLLDGKRGRKLLLAECGISLIAYKARTCLYLLLSFSYSYTAITLIASGKLDRLGPHHLRFFARGSVYPACCCSS